MALALAVPLAAAPAFAAEENAAIAINNEDGSSLFRFAFDVHKTMNSIIEETNIAISYASCEGCQTVAIAIQIVLVGSDPDSVVPENVAISINEECSSCETMASAYQFVVGTGGKTKLDKEGRKQIKAIRKAFYDLAVEAERGDLTNAQIEARLIPLVDRIKVVLDNNVVPADQPEDGEDGADGQGTDGTDGQPPGEEATPEPSSSPEPSPAATASGEPQPSPTAVVQEAAPAPSTAAEG